MPAASKSREVPAISEGTLWFFQWIVRSYFRRHFRSVMLQEAEPLVGLQGPLIVYANHSSWWDPMVSILLAKALLPERRHYAPMDAEALAKYPILRRLGIFPVEMSTARGAAQFLRTSQAVLEDGGVVWITPQGRFADMRAALEFKPGLGALALRVPGVTLLPLAIEYTFWNERLPETLLRLGRPLQLDAGIGAEAAMERLKAALATVMAELRVAAIARDARAFRVVLEGGRGTGGFYALGRRMRSRLTGQPLPADHTRREGGAESGESR